MRLQQQSSKIKLILWSLGNYLMLTPSKNLLMKLINPMRSIVQKKGGGVQLNQMGGGE